MDTLRQFNDTMQYIETHLDDEIDFSVVARLACCSEVHFRRMFGSLAGMSLGDYIRRRRLSQAGLELRRSDVRVIDVAVKYGYASADAFTRAFYALHGVTPSEARLNGAALKSVPPMTFQLTIRGGGTMDYRIVEKEAFYIVGLSRQVKLLYRGVNPEIAAMWESLNEAAIEELDALSNAEPTGILNASSSINDDRSEGSMINHIIGAATMQRPHTTRWQVLPVAAATWAVFPSRGKFPDALQDTWSRIYAEWLMTSGYEVSEGPEILWTGSEDFDDRAFHTEIWIPISRKRS